jgi:metallo-beta-lactamase family protein
MAIKASKVYWDYPHLYDEEATQLRRTINEMPSLRNLHLTASVEESMALNNIRSGAIIIAGSGMCTGGRIVHHLKRNIARQGAHVMIVGYQAYGTLGRKLVEGDERVKIHGDFYRVRAHVHTVGGLSAHGDVDDLSRWIGNFSNRPAVHVVHGEAQSKQDFRDRLERELGFRADVPEMGEVLEL